ncbi:MAG: repair protein RecO [Bacteroidota bacterium]
MLHKTLGIVLKTIPFRESSVVATIYTEKFGRQSYLINSIRTSKGGGKAALLQPLTVLDLVVYKHEQKKLERISEMKPAFHFQQITFDVVKNTMAFFIAELLYKAIHEDENHQELFDWVVEQLQYLDAEPKISASFHLQFMLDLCRHLGFYPNVLHDNTHLYFDMQNGISTDEIPSHLHYLKGDDCILMNKFLIDTESINNRLQRKRMLQIMAEYFTLHIPGFGKLKSPDVLESVLG